MPIHLLPNRRAFLSGLALGGVSTVLGCGGGGGGRPSLGDEPLAPPRLGPIALLSDTHIDADPVLEAGRFKQNMTKNLLAAVADVVAQPMLPSAVVVLGDLAHSVGLPGDYQQFLMLIQPLLELGVPVHLAMGNHDDRDVFLEEVKPKDHDLGMVEERYIGIVEAAGVRLVILDSLDQPKEVGGNLREPQLAWLSKALDAAPKSPTMVLVHHNPAATPEEAKNCLADTDELLAILRPRKQVKALVFGHTHTWKLGKNGDLHFVNLPAVGYPFAADQPLGWCRLDARRDGATIAMHRIGGEPGAAPETVDLAWRAT